jgi:hypothetical protein
MCFPNRDVAFVIPSPRNWWAKRHINKETNNCVTIATPLTTVNEYLSHTRVFQKKINTRRHIIIPVMSILLPESKLIKRRLTLAGRFRQVVAIFANDVGCASIVDHDRV